MAEKEGRKTGKTVRERIVSLFSYIRSHTTGFDLSRIKRDALEGKKYLARLYYIFTGAVLSCGTLLFGSPVLGLAFCVSVASKNAIFAFLGALIGSLFSGGAVFSKTVTLALALIGRIAVRYSPGSGGIFKEPLSVRCALSVALSFVLSLYSLISSGFALPSLYSLLFTVVSAPILTVIFSLARSDVKRAVLKDAGYCTVLFFIIYSLDSGAFFGISAGVIASAVITLAVAFRSGALRGFITGSLCGLACSLESTVAMGALGLAAGLLSQSGVLFASGCASVVGIVISTYISGYTSFFGFSADLLIGSAIFIPLYRAGLIPGFEFFESAEKSAASQTFGKSAERSRIFALSGAFEELSGELLSITGDKKRLETEYKVLSGEVIGKRCVTCGREAECPLRADSTLRAVCEKAAERLYKKGAISLDDIGAADGESFGECCPYAEEIIIDMNMGAAELCEHTVKRDKTELIALDYEAIAGILTSLASDAGREEEPDRELCRRASGALKDIGIKARGFTAAGDRIKTVTAFGIAIGSLSVSGSDITRALEKASGLPFGAPSFDFCGETVTMRISSARKIAARCEYISKARAGESLCGDCVRSFSDKNGSLYALICDGMGSGEGASHASEISAIFLEKMISAENDMTCVLRMLSNFIRSRDEECTCTADIVRIDLYKGEAVFTKCGAATSFLIRGDKSFAIDAHSLPIGVTRAIDPEEIRIKLSAGDLIIMMSDGTLDALSAGGESVYREGESSLDMKIIAEEILKRAERGGIKDDSSVAVIKILSPECENT